MCSTGRIVDILVGLLGLKVGERRVNGSRVWHNLIRKNEKKPHTFDWTITTQ